MRGKERVKRIEDERGNEKGESERGNEEKGEWKG